MDTIRSARDILLESLYIKTQIDSLSNDAIFMLAKKFRVSSRAAAHMMLKLLGVTKAQLQLAQHLVAQSEAPSKTGGGRKLQSLSELPPTLTLAEAIRRVCAPRKLSMDPIEAIRIAQPAEHHKAQTSRLIAIARLQATPSYCLQEALNGHWRPTNADGPIHDMIGTVNRSRYMATDPDAEIIVITEEAGRFWEEPHHYIWIGQDRATVRHTSRRRQQTRRPAYAPTQIRARAA